MDSGLLIDIMLWLVAALLIIVGLAGLVLPAMPGPPILLGGLVTAAWIEDFTYVGLGTLTLLAILAALTYAIDFIAGALGASRFGASPRAAWGAVIGGLLGIMLGPIGILVGPFFGALLGEISMQRSLKEASRAGLGATIGLVVGTALKLALAFAMLGIFALKRFF